MLRLRRALYLVLALTLLATTPSFAMAADGPFAGGWRLDPAQSRLFFQTIKNNAIVETSTFTAFDGDIAPDGVATIRIQLESIDTAIDLRNVRMRFLFFETFVFTEAVVTVKLDPTTLAGLATQRRLVLPLDYELDLHGVKQALTADAVVTLIDDGRVAVASAEPILISAEDFGLAEGVLKLEDAAKVDILPAGSVSFDFVFTRNGAAVAAAPATAAPAPVAPVAPAPVSAAVEPAGALSVEACAGRFEILSRTGAIYFKSGSAELDGGSVPLLKTVLDIAQRCPSLPLVVEGHTDAVGGEALNQRLSEERARSVAQYLVLSGVPADRVRHVGYGESRPVAPNDTERNRGRNRRIQFSVDGG